jgi:hypothetical protein
VVLVTSFLIGFFVLGPSIAKGSMDRAEISFTRLNITRVLSNESLLASADITVSNVAPLGCTIGAMKMNVMYEDQTFATLVMPEMSVQAFQDNHISVQDSKMYITDKQVWNTFAERMLRNKTVTWRLKSSATITAKAMGMSVTFKNVAFDKTMPLACFDGMPDVQMDVFDMSQSTPNKLVVNMKVCLKNPSAIAIMDLGDLNFGIRYRGAKMGNVTSTASAIAKPKDVASDADCLRFGDKGYNMIAMNGSLHPENHSVADELVSRYFSGQTSAVSAQASSPRASSVAIFNTPMQGLDLNTELNGNQDPLVTGLDLVSMMLQPVDDDTAKASMNANVSINNPLGAHSGLQLFNVIMKLNMSYGTSLVGAATTPNTTVPNSPTVFGNGTVNIPVPSVIMSLPEKGAGLAKLAKDLIKEDSITLNIDGTTDTLAICSALGFKMHIAGIPVKLPNSDAKPALPGVTVKGMGGLPDVNIIHHSIPGIVPDGTDGCPSMCGIQVSIKATVKNPAPVGLDVGTLNAQVTNENGVVLGTVSTNGLSLTPSSTLTAIMTGKLAPANSDLDAASDFFSAFLQNKAQTTKVVGKDAGSSAVGWLNDVVNGLELSTTFPGAGPGFSVLTGVEVQAMSMDLSPDKDPQVSGTIQATMQMPQDVDLSIISDVKSADMELDMIDPDTGKAMGHLSIDASSISLQYKSGQLTASFTTTTMSVTDSETFSKVIKQLLLTPQKEIKMSGTASPTVLTNMGTLSLKSVPFSSSATLRGFNGFADPNTGKSLMQVNSLDVVGGKDGNMNLVVDAQVVNPSNVAASMGAVSLELWTSGDGAAVKLGTLQIDDFSLGANNDGTAVTHFPKIQAVYTPPTGSPSAEAAGRKFLSNFVQGVAQAVEIRGAVDGSSTNIKLLKLALESFKTTSTAPGLSTPSPGLLLFGLMYIPKPWSLYDLPTALTVQNPLTADMNFRLSHCDIYACNKFSSDNKACEEYYNESTGYYSPDNIAEVVPGRGQHVLKTHTVKLYKLLTPEMIKTFFTSSAGGSFIRLKGYFEMSIGDTQITVDYEESGVPICLDYLGHPCKHSGNSANTTLI